MKLKNKRALKNFLVQIMLFNPDLKSYMINMRKRFDEVGAERLLHDMLMKSSEKKEKLQKEVKYNCQSKKFSAEEIRKRAKHYASIIARHNM